MKVSYQEAIEMCLNLESRYENTSLWTPNTLEEYSVFSDQLTQLSSKPFWLHLTDQTQEGTFLWGDGTPLKFDNWNNGEPNDWGGQEDCATFNCGGETEWNDVSCNDRYGFICQVQ